MFLIPLDDGRVIDLGALWDLLYEAAQDVPGHPTADGPSTVVGFLLGLRFALDHPDFAAFIQRYFERQAAVAMGETAEEIEVLMRLMADHLLEGAAV